MGDEDNLPSTSGSSKNNTGFCDCAETPVESSSQKPHSVHWAASSTTENSSTSQSTDMKRVAAQLIGRYYYQLTDGCGSPSCDNPNCASSGHVKNVSKDEAAAKALQLFSARARVCDVPSGKVPRVAQPDSFESAAIDEKLKLVNEIISCCPTDLDSSPLSCDSEAKQCTAKESLKGLTYDLLEATINECKACGNYAKLRILLWVVFTNDELLKHSFLKPLQTEDISKCKSNSVISSNEMEISEDSIAENVDSLYVSSKELRSSGKYDLDKDIDSFEAEASAASLLPKHTSNSPSLSTDSLAKSNDTADAPKTVWCPTVDVESLRNSYDILFKCPDSEFYSTLIETVVRLISDSLAIQIKVSPELFFSDGQNCNIFIILLENPALDSIDYIQNVLAKLSKVIVSLGVQEQAALVRYFAAHWNAARLRSLLESLHTLISIEWVSSEYSQKLCINEEENITAATKFLKLLYYANIMGGKLDCPLLKDIPQDTQRLCSSQDESDPFGSSKDAVLKPPSWDPLAEALGIHVLDCVTPLIPFSEFYHDLLSDQLEVEQDFTFYKTDRDQFCFLRYPFILTPATKALGLYFDSRIRMFTERRLSMYQTFMEGFPINPYLRLRVKREHIIDDALVVLEMVAHENPTDLRKQLVVEFEGEQGIDEGGVSKEFFQIIVEKIFNPDYGMFCLNQETDTFWFNPTSFENEGQFTLIGIVIGLAIYNNAILDLHFPPVIYKKLSGKKGTFHDLKDWNPTLYRSLLDLLEYEGDDMEETFLQTFKIGYEDVFGTCLWHELKEDGDNVTVGQCNKHEFVELYADFLLNKMIEEQFSAFYRGFSMVTSDSPLQYLFRPEELELLVCGTQEYDFLELMKSVEYDGGYNSDSPVIKAFWEIVQEISTEDKKQLLQFTTGSARVPVGGLGRVKLIIARHGSDTDRLPTAHTCFNALLLPEYSSKDKLKDKLMLAIKYAQGFGML